MTVLEKRFMETVPGYLRDIAASVKAIAKKSERRLSVWVFTANQVADDDVCDTIVEVYETEADAKRRLYDFVHGEEGELAYAQKRGWKIAHNDPDCYEAYEEGYYAGNHTELTVEEKVIL